MGLAQLLRGHRRLSPATTAKRIEHALDCCHRLVSCTGMHHAHSSARWGVRTVIGDDYMRESILLPFLASCVSLAFGERVTRQPGPALQQVCIMGKHALLSALIAYQPVARISYAFIHRWSRQRLPSPLTSRARVAMHLHVRSVTTDMFVCLHTYVGCKDAWFIRVLVRRVVSTLSLCLLPHQKAAAVYLTHFGLSATFCHGGLLVL
jgi:hypothetical protein